MPVLFIAPGPELALGEPANEYLLTNKTLATIDDKILLRNPDGEAKEGSEVLSEVIPALPVSQSQIIRGTGFSFSMTSHY